LKWDSWPFCHAKKGVYSLHIVDLLPNKHYFCSQNSNTVTDLFVKESLDLRQAIFPFFAFFTQICFIKPIPKDFFLL
jgi:hypothetical protein